MPLRLWIAISCLLLRDVKSLTVPSRLLYSRDATIQNCQNPSSKLHPLCWDVLNMEKWMQDWNSTTTTCYPDELWANCFMRQAGMSEIDPGGKIGCAQVGPNTCPEPSQAMEDQVSVSVEMRYGAYSIWCTYFVESI